MSEGSLYQAQRSEGMGAGMGCASGRGMGQWGYVSACGNRVSVDGGDTITKKSTG